MMMNNLMMIPFHTNISIDSIDGYNLLKRVNYYTIYMSCAPKSLLMYLPGDSSGIASLSKRSLSLVSQFSESKLPKKFGLCLGSRGVIVFGSGQYNLLPPLKRNMTEFLSYTSFLDHPKDASGYYIGVKGISVNSQSVNLHTNTFSLDEFGNEGVKLSTITPYTTLKTHIYWALLKKFAMSTNTIPRVPKIAPFDYCINTTELGTTQTGLNVPKIDLERSNGANWTIFGPNSMTRIIDDIDRNSCLYN
ncbi:hypothetical protein RND81_04G073500 [Saponaria officinalis]|uniref:Xylanase inhibitor N-terminal domain-containing protein n=1 Tax=Saponaria officinalis TaxID=3572 RepID=A0AAW1LDH0_SAPOF